MLEKIKTRTKNWIRSNANNSVNPILEKLSDSLNQELNLRLKELSKFTDTFPIIEALHLEIDNLTNTKVAIEQVLRLKSSVGTEVALVLLNEQIIQTEKILQSEILINSCQATEIGSRVLNMLFCAKQTIKRKFSVITPIKFVEGSSQSSELSSTSEMALLADDNNRTVPDLPRLVVSSTLLYQLHQSLFPAEKMMVGAGKRTGQNVSIDAVFDVTGDASAGYVRANPDRLGRALIAMSETDTYFALWIHSHPGRGKEASCPSSIDRNQEIDWLRDYSVNLVNAIMVEDRFVRFWGKALEEKRVVVEVAGTGVKKENENIYRLEC